MTLRLVLASASPRRETLLRALRPDFDIRPADLDEDALLAAHPGSPPERLAELLARAKAAATVATPDELVLGADTLVALGGDILGKPADADDARRILRALSGSRHRVITGVCLRRFRDGREWTGHCVTGVDMLPMSGADIDAYIASGEPFGKAGAYAIQETGDRFVRALDGPYDNVVGLPIDLVRSLLREAEGR